MANAVPVGADPAVTGGDLADADDLNEVGVDQLTLFLHLALARMYSQSLSRTSPLRRPVFH